MFDTSSHHMKNAEYYLSYNEIQVNLIIPITEIRWS